jgi:hypothetical protein
MQKLTAAAVDCSLGRFRRRLGFGDVIIKGELLLLLLFFFFFVILL